ncbi:DUF6052 family protein [Streptomyces sp. ST2-7A]|uniref:DUF6052 family protein n=1 Tax=Streptomyces sp. ST2-7A TaxID=2907214 RepID=UPI001F327DA3|nr:DUF6052 family protein [Streptomyces sp. ST2-7A]MCE7079487.1 DUF6052 family protein [Streptomyces sp. ST2-7A]
MTNEPIGLLTPEQERDLLTAHRTLLRIMDHCEVPAVRAAVLAAEAELRIALDGQGIECDFYRRPGSPAP